MNLIHGCDNVRIRGRVLQQESANVGLTMCEKIPDSLNDWRGSDGDCFVKAGEERSSGDGECQNLGVDIGDRRFRDLLGG